MGKAPGGEGYDVTGLLHAWRAGDRSAPAELTALEPPDPGKVRAWSAAKVWLYHEMRGGAGDGPGTLEASR